MPNPLPDLPTTLSVVFDGRCAFCALVTARLRGWDRHQRIRFVPCQAPELPAHPALTRETCSVAVIAITPEGCLVSGGEAAFLMLAVLTGRRWWWRMARWPLASAIIGAGYRWVASIRRHLPGTTPWCDEHPEECCLE